MKNHERSIHNYLRPVVVCALFCSLSCASMAGPASDSETANQRLYATYGKALEVAAVVYRESMIAAGIAVESGQISEEQLSVIRHHGKVVEESLRVAKAALMMAVDGSADSGNVQTHMSVLETALSELSLLMTQARITKGADQ